MTQYLRAIAGTPGVARTAIVRTDKKRNKHDVDKKGK